MNDETNQDNRPTKRRLVDSGTDDELAPGPPDQVLVAEELESIRNLANENKGDLEVPWGNSLKLDEDDWILRQIFQTAGLNPKRQGHWRLLLGILAEFQVDPSLPDEFKRGHTADSISSSRWTPNEREELFEQAIQMALEHPKWRRPRIAAELAKKPRWARTGEAWKGQPNKPAAIKRVLESVIAEKRKDMSEGKLNSDLAEKERVEEQLRAFRKHSPRQD